MSGQQKFEIDTVTVEALPEAKPHTVTFAVNAALDEVGLYKLNAVDLSPLLFLSPVTVKQTQR
jgi:hypothetical protein